MSFEKWEKKVWIKILKFYTDLDKLAKKYGGRVISLLGNHELLNVNGTMRYVSGMGMYEFNNINFNKHELFILGKNEVFCPIFLEDCYLLKITKEYTLCNNIYI